MEVQEAQQNEYDHHEITDNGEGRSMGYRFELTFLLPRQFHSKIRYAKGDTKKLLEGQTVIKMPPRGDSKQVVIKGNTKAEVVETKQRVIKFITDVATRSRQTLTHFLSVKFTSDEIKQNFGTFRDDVINEFGFHKTLLQKPEKLHITLVMLELPGDQEKNKACECLATCKDTIIDPVLKGLKGPLTVRISGVSLFKDERPSRAHILFGNVMSDELQHIANKIAKYFDEQGLIKLTDDNVILHLTMINTGFYKPDNREGNFGHTRKNKRHGPFDASRVLAKYKDYNFGSVTLNEIQISQIGSRGEDGFYLSIGKLQF